MFVICVVSFTFVQVGDIKEQQLHFLLHPRLCVNIFVPTTMIGPVIGLDLKYKQTLG
jgi:hypothetical protein